VRAIDLLKKVTGQNLENSSVEEITELACAYWHENFVPALEDIEILSKDQQIKAGYITEFFSTFNCIDRDQTLRLVEISTALKMKFKPAENEKNTDEIAAEWGLSENLNRFHKDILFYQTRHYKHNK